MRIRTAWTRAGMCLNTSKPQSWSWKKPESSHMDLVMVPEEDSQPQGRKKRAHITAAGKAGIVQGLKAAAVVELCSRGSCLRVAASGMWGAGFLYLPQQRHNDNRVLSTGSEVQMGMEDSTGGETEHKFDKEQLRRPEVATKQLLLHVTGEKG